MSDATLSSPSESAHMGRSARVTAAIAIVVTPSLYSFQFASFSDAKLAGWAVAAVVLAAIVPNAAVAVRILLHRYGPLVALIVCSFALVVLSRVLFAANDRIAVLRFAAVPDFALVSLTTTSLLLIAAALAASAWPGRQRNRALAAVAASGLPVAALGLLQFAGVLRGMFPQFAGYDQRVYSVFGNQDLFGGYLAISLALGLGLGLTGAIPRTALWGGAAVLLPALLISGSRSAWVAAVAGCALAVAQHPPGTRRFARGAAWAIALMVLTAALAPAATLDRALGTLRADDVGYRARLWIWDGTARMIREHVWFGVGPGNFQFHSPRYLGEAIYAKGPGGHYYNRIHTLHAHSDYLELAAETGVLGAAALLFFIALLPRVRHPAWIGLAAGLVFSIANTTAHSPPHVIAMLLCAAVLPHAALDVECRAAPRFGVRAILLVATLAISLRVVSVALIPSYRVAQAEETLNSADPAGQIAAYAAVQRLPGVGYDASRALAILDANAEQFDVAQDHVERALRGLDTGDVHYLAGYIAEQRGDAGRAAREYEACIARWPNHVRAWEGRLRLSAEAGRDGLLAEALPWLEDRAAGRLTSLRERLRTESAPRSAATAP